MNLFRSEEHLKRWLQYFRAAGDYAMPVEDWATVFSTSIFKRRLDADYLARSSEYLEEYRAALRAMGKVLPAPDRILSTIMFTDIVSSTEQAAAVGDAEWRSRLEDHNNLVRTALEHFGGREIKQTGDGFLAAFASPAKAVECALTICGGISTHGLEVRAGIHLGECEVLGNDLGGIAVHIGARIGSVAAPGEVLVSEAVKEAVTGSPIRFDSRQVHQLKGVPGRWHLHAAVT